MRRGKNIFQELTLGADLPGESLPRQLLVELIGDSRVLIENHCGVTAYGRNEICVKTNCGLIHICGEGLELARMSKEQLVILGNIFGIKLQRGNH